MKQRLIAIAADVACVLVFVLLGRSSHDEGNGIVAVANVAAPFLIGLAVGWLLAPSPRRRPFAIATGVQVWLTTVGIGVVLRWFAWDRGTAVSFIVVAAAVPRVVPHRVARGDRRSDPSPQRGTLVPAATGGGTLRRRNRHQPVRGQPALHDHF